MSYSLIVSQNGTSKTREYSHSVRGLNSARRYALKTLEKNPLSGVTICGHGVSEHYSGANGADDLRDKL